MVPPDIIRGLLLVLSLMIIYLQALSSITFSTLARVPMLSPNAHPHGALLTFA